METRSQSLCAALAGIMLSVGSPGVWAGSFVPESAGVFPSFDQSLQQLNATPSAKMLAVWHELLGSEPHVAGTDADAREIGRIRDAFVAMGLTTTTEEFAALLPQPIDALVEIVGATDLPVATDGRRGVLSLPTVERNLASDPATQHPGLNFGWNAYSASGDVTAGVVYANYGTKADFEKLKSLGIDCKGKVVLARYGGNFRGYKAKFAEEAGAVAVIIYTDPADTGSTKGKVWPEGGWANDTCVQRGSILTSSQPGDPGTPFAPSVAGCVRQSEEQIGLPKIPVQPIGYAAAAEIMRRMRGTPVQEDSGWKGGLPFEYRLTGGDDLQIRVKVQQDRAIRNSANVIGMITGAVNPEQCVIIGCHHDAWGFGAADPLAGTIVLMECARSFSEAARNGNRPARTVIFAAWGAEEFGIIGSTEWVEGHRDRLLKSAVTYINLDMASMGLNFSASCSPSLREAILGSTVRVSQARGTNNETVYDRLSGGGRKDPQFGEVGGGSDHVAFNCHVGVACAALGAGGSEGNSYHSNYDTINWYRSVVGEDYASALMVTRMTNALASMIANSPIVPLSAARHGLDAERLLRRLKDRTKDAVMSAAIDPLIARAVRTAEAGAQLDAALASAHPWLGRAAANKSTVAREACNRIDQSLISLDRAWLDDGGLSDRPWFRNMFAATDKDSGYAATMLPLLAEAVDAGDAARVQAAALRYQAVFDRLDRGIESARAVVQASTSGNGPPAPLGSR